MQPTYPPWSEAERRRRGRLSLGELGEITRQLQRQELREMRARLDWPRVHRHNIVLYTPKQLQQLVRLGSAAQAVPPTGAVWRAGPRVDPWLLPDLQSSRQPSPGWVSGRRVGYSAGGAVPANATGAVPASAGGAGGAAPASAGRAAAAGDANSQWYAVCRWGFVATLLLTTLMVLRTSEHFFNALQFARERRRRRAAARRFRDAIASGQHNSLNADCASPTDFEAYLSESSDSSNEFISLNDIFRRNNLFQRADLPPSYSECTRNANKRVREDPPPPYSTCFVAFSNPKDGTPSVRFLNGQLQTLSADDRGTCTRYLSSQTSIEEITEIAHSSNSFKHIDTGQVSDNPIGDRIHSIPYFENSMDGDDESDDCSDNCVVDSLEAINVGPAPLASEELSTDASDDATTGTQHSTEIIVGC